MFPFTIKTFIEILCLFIAVTFANGQDRQLESQLNPGCSDCDTVKRPLIYTRAQGSDDTIHQLWDFTDHVPAVAYLIGGPNSTLNITWKNSSPERFEFSESPALSYSFAAAIESIIEYNDLKDNGQYDPDIPKSDKRYWPLDHTSWELTNSVLTKQEALVMLRGNDSRSGVIEMKLDILPFKDYALELPHLIHTANSTLIDIRLVNLTDYRSFNSSRFALRLVLVSTDNQWDSWTKDMRKSLDDEHTPGVFEIIEIKSSRISGGGFVQFRPVAYTEPERGVSSSTNAYITNLNKTVLPSRSILRILYRDYWASGSPGAPREPPGLVVQDAVVSFGLAGDGFYRHNNFTAWSFTIGYGSPPLEGFSLFVVIIISIGLGVPALLALGGAAYLLARRCRPRNPPARFTDDD